MTKKKRVPYRAKYHPSLKKQIAEVLSKITSQVLHKGIRGQIVASHDSSKDVWVQMPDFSKNNLKFSVGDKGIKVIVTHENYDKPVILDYPNLLVKDLTPALLTIWFYNFLDDAINLGIDEFIDDVFNLSLTGYSLSRSEV